MRRHDANGSWENAMQCVDAHERMRKRSLELQVYWSLRTQEREAKLRALRIDRMQALTLGVVATRLRSKYGSVEAARKHWEDEAIELAEMQEIIERDHGLFLLLRGVLGWNSW